MADAQTSDLGWLAFQYINDELTASEAAEFEEQLARDQQAREAVAEMVLLTQAITADRTAWESVVTPAAPVRKRWRAAMTWTACGAAACVAVIAASRYWSADRVATDKVISQSAAENEAIALAWAQAASSIENEADLSAADGLLGFEEGSVLSSDAESHLLIPVWMFEAVHGLDDAQGRDDRAEDHRT